MFPSVTESDTRGTIKMQRMSSEQKIGNKRANPITPLGAGTSFRGTLNVEFIVWFYLPAKLVFESSVS